MRRSDGNNEWYETVLQSRAVRPRRASISDAIGKPKCYALTLKIGVSHRIHAYFYDKRQKYFFGNLFCGEWHRSVANSVPISEVTFFWCPFHDDVDIILELVEREQPGQNSNLITAAWTSVSLDNSAGHFVADYSSVNHDDLFYRQPLYLGSPKALFFMDAAEAETTEFLRTANGSLEICLQTHQKMYRILNFVPEWYISGRKEDIAGLRTFSDGALQLAAPEPIEGRTYILNQIEVSFGTDADKFEQILLHLMNNDRLYRANRSPADINVKSMEVLERRIKIGVHNGLRYVEGPQCLHLSPSKDQISGNLDERRNFRSMTGSSTELTSELQNLVVNGSVILNKMISDARFAVVFSLDYLVGVYSYDGTVYSSQSVMVCWGAWCPFAANSNAYGQITIPLLGGPSINPDERLGFKNMPTFRSDLPFGDQLPRIMITFVHLKLNEDKLPADASQHWRVPKSSNRKATEFQNKPVPINKKLEKGLENRSEVKSLPPPSAQRVRPSAGKASPKVEPKMEPKKGKEKYPEGVFLDEYQKPDVDQRMQIYSLPAMRIANISRAWLAVLADVQFAAIRDRNGNKPKFVDIEQFPIPDINIELNDKLNTNETIVQFMAVSFWWQENRHIELPTAIFFTMQFYRFKAVTTERLQLDSAYEKNGQQEQLYILKRGNKNGDSAQKDCNGFTVKYMIDRNWLPEGEENDCINYLLSGHLIVDVWDADSLLPLGTSCIPLKYLLRHGSEAVQADIQSTVVLNCLPETSAITCQILLRLANIGYPSTKQIGFKQCRSSAVVSRRLRRIGQDEIEPYRIRAKPLNPIHENALQRFLTSQRLDINQRYSEVMNGVPVRAQGQDPIQPLITKGSVKRYLFEQELEAYKKLRNEDKASKLLKAVFNAVTTEHRIFPKYGQRVFFEFLLQNTESEATVVTVDASQSTLRPLLDAASWQYYKNAYRIETRLEENLYRVSEENGRTAEVNIFLKPMGTTYAPFVYDGFTLPQEQTRNQVKVVFKKNDGEPIAILDLLVENRHNIITNSFRFYHEAETTLSRIIRITRYRDEERVQALRCTDPLVLLTLKNNTDGSQDLLFTYQIGKSPSLRTFAVIFFADKYYDTVLGAWLIHIHAVQRISLNAVRAQLIKTSFILKVDNDDCLVQFYSSSRNLKIHPSEIVRMQSGTVVDVVAYFISNLTGTEEILVSAIDQRTKDLLNEWLVVANVQETNITKMFEVYLEANKSQTVKLTVGNRYSVDRSFHISCSHPEYVQIENEVVNLAANKVIDIYVTFLASKEPILSEVLIFVTNAENNIQEEAYSLKLIYHN